MRWFLWTGLLAGFLCQAQVLEDPTRPASTSPSSVGSAQQANSSADGMPQVSAIFIGPQQRHAIVDGEPLYPGQHYQSMELIEIRTGSVLFRHNDKNTEVFLRQGKTMKKGKANGF